MYRTKGAKVEMEGIYLDDTPRHIGGISCSCRNCVYHDGDNYCTAERISVGTVTASCSSETVCATFKPRERDHFERH